LVFVYLIFMRLYGKDYVQDRDFIISLDSWIWIEEIFYIFVKLENKIFGFLVLWMKYCPFNNWFIFFFFQNRAQSTQISRQCPNSLNLMMYSLFSSGKKKKEKKNWAYFLIGNRINFWYNWCILYFYWKEKSSNFSFHFLIF